MTKWQERRKDQPSVNGLLIINHQWKYNKICFLLESLKSSTFDFFSYDPIDIDSWNLLEKAQIKNNRKLTLTERILCQIAEFSLSASVHVLHIRRPHLPSPPGHFEGQTVSNGGRMPGSPGMPSYCTVWCWHHIVRIVRCGGHARRRQGMPGCGH